MTFAEALTKPLNGHGPAVTPLTMAQAQALHHAGHVETSEGGVIYRPTPDKDGRAEPAPDGFATHVELAAVRAACEPLARVEAEQRAVDEQARAARCDADRAKRAELPALAERAEALKEEHAQLRGSARQAYLASIEQIRVRRQRSFEGGNRRLGQDRNRRAAFERRKLALTTPSRLPESQKADAHDRES